MEYLELCKELKVLSRKYTVLLSKITASVKRWLRNYVSKIQFPFGQQRSITFHSSGKNN